MSAPIATDSAELSEWLAYDCAYGLPDGYYVAATIGAATFNAMSGKSPEPDYFAPIFERPDDEATPDDNLRAAQAFAAAHNRGT